MAFRRRWFAILALIAASGVPRVEAQDAPGRGVEQATVDDREPFLLGPPSQDGPVLVRVGFELHNVNEINDEAETFEFAGTLVLQWLDKRQAFDPTEAGVLEKVFQGDFQFNEIATGWYPQVVLINEAGMFETHGVVLRVRPDGRSTLTQTVNGNAKTRLSMRKYPFDHQRLEAVFAVLGFTAAEVVLLPSAEAAGLSSEWLHVPQWAVTGADLSVRGGGTSDAGPRAGASKIVVGVDVARKPFFIIRLVMIPLAVIVLLSFSVFWMDRSSLGDRISVSFIGILTAVAYQMVTSEIQPRIAYFTLLHGFMNLSFLMMCATVVINLVVGALDKRGKAEAGDRLDRRCRWVFPLVYFGLFAVMIVVAFTLF